MSAEAGLPTALRSVFSRDASDAPSCVQPCIACNIDKADNIARGLRAFEAAARGGAELVCFAELAFEPFYPQNPAGAATRAG